MKIVIVGGVAGGATCAARLRRLDESAEIIIFERSGFISYANCGLPYYIGGEIPYKESLTLQSPMSFYSRFRIIAKVNHEVISVDKDNKQVKVKNLETGETFDESYDKLVLSPGAYSFVPDYKGIESKKIFTLRTVEDTFLIKETLAKNNYKNVTVVGAGFIGLEMAENLVNLGLKVTMVQRSGQVLKPLDSDMASILHSELRQNGVNLLLNKTITEFVDNNKTIITKTKQGDNIESDMVILAIGVKPETSLCKTCGIETGESGGIKVNEYMETSVKDIYACGDAVEINHIVTDKKGLISLAGPANKQGRIVADNICGIKHKFKGGLGSSVIKVFDLTASSTGINEKTAKKLGINYDYVILSPANHATYYPGAISMTMKVVFDKDNGRILGGQIVGYDGVDKRIDVLATAIYNKMTCDELTELDLAYAPPYSSAKDPVNMAGYMIQNIVDGLTKQFHYEDIESLKERNDITLLDTRTTFEYSAGHVDGFKNIPVDELRERIDEIEKNKPVYVMCQSGLRSYISCRILNNLGYDSYNFAGGYRFYSITDSEIKLNSKIYPCGMEIK